MKRPALFPTTLLIFVLIILLLGCPASPAVPQPATAPPPTLQTTPAPAPPPAAPQLKVTSLKVTPPLVLPGQKATAEAAVTNTGNAKGSLNVVLNVNGIASDSRPVSLEPGASSNVLFSITRDVPSKYDMTCGESASSLQVADIETYTNKSFFFSLPYPKGWTPQESRGSSVTCKREGVGAINASAEAWSTATNIGDYTAEVADVIQKSLGSYNLKILSQDSYPESLSIPARKITYSYTASGVEYKGTMLVMLKGRFGFIAGIELPALDKEGVGPVLTACLHAFRPSEIVTDLYTNTSYGFTLQYPGGWSAMNTGKLTPVLLGTSAASGPSVTTALYVFRGRQNESAKDLVSNYLSEISKQSGYKIESEGSHALGKNTEGYQRTVTYNSSTSTMTQKAVGAVRGTQGFLLSISGQSAAISGASSSIDQFIKSLTLEDPRPFGVARNESLFLYEGAITTLDPAVSEMSPEGVLGAIFSGLVRFDKDLNIVPDLAESWKVSPDGKTYTFILRKGARFHDGKLVTASDVKYSWERACDPATKSTKAQTYLGDIKGAAEMLSGKAKDLSGVKAIDDVTLEVTLDAPKAYFLGKLAYVTAFVVDRANVARGMNWSQTPNGTGPFKLKEWKQDELLILERNNDFYKTPPKLANVVLQVYSGVPMMMYERGEIDVAPVSTTNIERALNQADPLSKQVITTRSLDTGYLGFNVSKPPFDDPKVRRAFALAIDIDKIIEVSMKGRADRATGFVPPGIPGNNTELKPLPYQPDQAKQLIKESKYGDVSRLPPVTITVYAGVGPVVQAMIAMWRQNLGVDVKVETIKELKEFFERRSQRDFQLFSSAWRADYVDPQNFLEVLFQSSSPENTFDYLNASVDSALKSAAVMTDKTARLKAYQDIEKAILVDLPAVPLYWSQRQYELVKPYVNGFYVTGIGTNCWADVTVTPR